MQITVYLGSNSGASVEYFRLAERFGRWIGENGHALVYGVSSAGLMGALATSALESGAEVTGVLPNVESILSRKQQGLSRYIYTESVSERRSRMIELADAFVALPGGLGTIDEITEVLSLASLKLTPKPIVVLGVNGYYAPLKGMLEHMIATGFSRREYLGQVCFTEDIDEAARFMATHALV